MPQRHIFNRTCLIAGLAIVASCSKTPVPVQAAALTEPDGEMTGTWSRVDADAGRISDIAGLQALAEAFPDSGSVQLRLLNAYLAADDLERGYDAIATLTARGYALSAGARAQLLDIYDGIEREKLAGIFREAARGGGASEPFATIPAAAKLVESLAYDPQAEVLYATTVISRALFARGADGQWRALDIPGAAALTGVVRDPDTGFVWVASGDPGLGSEPVPGFRGLIAYDPFRGSVARRIAAPVASNPSDLTLGPGGTLYVSDPLSGAIYRATRDAEALDLLVPPGTFRSPQGLAVDTAGRFLYASDYRYGLALVDLRSGRVDRLPAESGIYLDGIDGLWRRGDELVAVQNGSSPMRILRLALSGDGRAIRAVSTLEQTNPAWTEPLGGTVDGDRLLYVANGQWDRFIEGGAPDPDNLPGSTEVRALPLIEKPELPPKTVVDGLAPVTPTD